MEDKNVTLEEHLAALEELLQQLEGDNLTLDETFSLYKEGMGRIQTCNKLIDRVEKELEILEEGSMSENE